LKKTQNGVVFEIWRVCKGKKGIWVEEMGRGGGGRKRWWWKRCERVKLKCGKAFFVILWGLK